MSTKHTPGPWRADAVSRGTINARTGERSELRPDGYAITAEEPRQFGGTRLVQSGLSAADARLIAAAPDLLAALCEIVGMYGPEYEPNLVITRARAAIAKAVQP